MNTRTVQRLNVDFGCDNKCGNCERYFECAAPQKSKYEKSGILKLAAENMAGIKHKILVLGGKGGVGKSMAAVNLAMALASKGNRVAILDQVFDCPAVPTMLGLSSKNFRLKITDEGLIPGVGPLGVKVISMGLILEEDEVLVWFHDMKRNAAEEFLCNVVYGQLDYLIIDVPAGTSSETVNVMKLIPDLTGSFVITVPSEVSQNVAKRAVLISQKAGVPVLGIIENMGPCLCPQCSEPIEVLQSGGGSRLAEQTGVPFVGSIPMDLMVSESLDDGEPFIIKHPESKAAKVIMKAIEMLESSLKKNQ